MDYLTAFNLKEAGIKAVHTALVDEAQKRKNQDFKVWSAAEANAVCAAAGKFAQTHGLRVPLLEEVVAVERQAMGHSDYAKKWSLYVVEICFRQAETKA